MNGFVGGVSLTATQRRRFLYCAWWTAPPCRDPFRAPDATGSAATREEALAAAARAAGRPLPEIEGLWAGAVVRLQQGKPPFFVRGPRVRRGTEDRGRKAGPRWEDAEGCPFAALGLCPGASAPEVRRAFLELALRTHPDRGGDAVAFHRARRAYQAARQRAG